MSRQHAPILRKEASRITLKAGSAMPAASAPICGSSIGGRDANAMHASTHYATSYISSHHLLLELTSFPREQITRERGKTVGKVFPYGHLL
jgi:hypothetical protein